MNKNNDAWLKLFDKYNIIDDICKNGRSIITAEQIKEFREPRLMTKFDHEMNLPNIFKENNLSILPITRGSYVIAPFKLYHQFEKTCEETKKIPLPSYLQSLSPENISNEAMALNCAFSCGILADFLEDDGLYPTVSGRMGSGEFSFYIDLISKGKQQVDVRNSQIEIDAAYEGLQYLALFEAKNEIYDDFLIRQLYYPYRAWLNRVSKTIKTVFLTYSNGTFSLFEYTFAEQESYNSLKLKKHTNYHISTSITIFDIQEIIKTEPLEREPEIPFPQADSMERIINLLETLWNEDKKTKESITDMYTFDKRQTNYYTDAGRYLGLIEKTLHPVEFSLSRLGKKIMSKSYRDRQLAIIKQIIRHRPFREVLSIHLRKGEMPTRIKIIEIMKESHLYNINSQKTFYRRASTIIGWVNWILSIVESD